MALPITTHTHTHIYIYIYIYIYFNYDHVEYVSGFRSKIYIERIFAVCTYIYVIVRRCGRLFIYLNPQSIVFTATVGSRVLHSRFTSHWCASWLELTSMRASPNRVECLRLDQRSYRSFITKLNAVYLWGSVTQILGTQNQVEHDLGAIWVLTVAHFWMSPNQLCKLSSVHDPHWYLMVIFWGVPIHLETKNWGESTSTHSLTT
jgi:hypothetical protein